MDMKISWKSKLHSTKDVSVDWHGRLFPRTRKRKLHGNVGVGTVDYHRTETTGMS